MTITLDLSPSEEALLRAKAVQQGKGAEAYAADLLKRDIEMPALLPIEANPFADLVEAAKREAITPLPQGSDEWRTALRDMGKGRQGVILSIEATSSESIYEDDMR